MENTQTEELTFEKVEKELSRKYLESLLDSDFDFHGKDSLYGTHGVHSFPAKFPPQIPFYFIDKLTEKNDIVLDPMMGSGTAVVEALLNERNAFGIDLDPLAYKITKVKITPVDETDAWKEYNRIDKRARKIVFENEGDALLDLYFDKDTKKFLDYWFLKDTQRELVGLIDGINKVEDASLKEFFELVFSSVIITKTGGVSLAMDLAHSRPHKVISKKVKKPLEQFPTKFKRVLEAVLKINKTDNNVGISIGDAREMPYDDSSIDLIITSPPYASNAIDYMRAHKFSLVWFGYPIKKLSELRGNYIGSEIIEEIPNGDLPGETYNVISKLKDIDERKAKHLYHYVSDMNKALKQMNRVLRPNKCAVIIIGSSTMRGIDVKTHELICEAGVKQGLELIGIGTRSLDRNKRMLPVGNNKKDNGIEDRMHNEYIILYQKPKET